MKCIKDLITFLEKLEQHKIHYTLNKTRINTIMVEIAVPGERWEVEFSTYETNHECGIEIEKFKSDGMMYGEEELDALFRDFSD